MTSFLHLGDCLDVQRDMPADSVVTDPPYGLRFMGKACDGSVPSVEVWAECLRVLKPGGHWLAFAATQTQHRMAVAIEDAGFGIRDMIASAYGSGFPKSQNVGRDVSEFEGWGTALKPALEPITVARKPLEGTVAKNVLAHETGALNIDGCRIPHASAEDAATAFLGGRVTSYGKGSLVTPPGGTMLAPFMGTGSTGCGSVMEGHGFLGIDLEPEYVEIARHRIAAAERQVAQEAEAARVAAEKAARQPDLFQEGNA